MDFFDRFKTSRQEEPQQQQQPTWNPDTLTMQQPSSPNAPTTEPVVSQQPKSQESMQMSLRGGGAGEICCGVCSGLLCFECCEDCC